MKDYYTLEYSPKQKCFHYDQVSGMVKYNIETCMASLDRRPDYICLGIFATAEERQKVKDFLSDLFRGKNYGESVAA